MYLYLIPPLYVIFHFLLFLTLDWWFDHGFEGYHRKKVRRIILFLIVCLIAAVPLLGCFLPDSGVKFALTAAGNIWLGIFLYFGGTGFLLSLAAAVSGIIGKNRTAKSRRAARTILAAAVSAGIVINAFGFCHAQDVRVHTLTVDVDKPLAADGASSLRVVLIGDLHMSVNSRPETIRRMVDLINEQDADLVLAAGDFLTSTYRGLKNPEVYAEILRGIRAKYGAYAVYGNHDVEEPLLGGFPMTPISKAFRSDEIISFIGSCGFRVLSDEITETADGSIVLVGREDGEKTGRGSEKRMEASALMSGIDTEKPVFVLQHEPKDFRNLAEAGADLVLCGHTHAGQVFPGNFIVRLFNRNHYGLKKVDGVQTVVTSGIGYYGPPLRVGTDSEIMVITVRFA